MQFKLLGKSRWRRLGILLLLTLVWRASTQASKKLLTSEDSQKETGGDMGDVERFDLIWNSKYQSFGFFMLNILLCDLKNILNLKFMWD